MLGIDYRAARAAWTVFLVALLIATAYAIRATLVVLATALLFAYLLLPLVDLLRRHTPPQISPTLALALVYVMFIGALVGLGITIGSRIATEAAALADRLPDLVRNRAWIDQIPLPRWLEPGRDQIIGAIQSELDAGGRDLLPYLKDLPREFISASKYLLDTVLVPILAFFFLKDGPRMRESLVDSLVDASQRPMVEDILADINRLLGQYIRALVLLALASFLAYTLFLGITGGPYVVLLAGVAAALEFIPVVGPFTAAVLVAAVVGFSGYTHLVWFAVFWIAFRLFQDYILSPHLMSSGVELSPVLVLFGVLAGERIAGIAGMFFSVPVLATLRVIFVRVQRARRRELYAPTSLQA
jgi:predicted PurR-regulated permease PerM